MLEGLFAAAAGMEAQQTQLDAISNDIANADTPGYQSTRVGFRDLLHATGAYNGSSSVAVGTGAAAAVIGYDQTPGAIEQTGQPLDVAIVGSGYLQVRQADGTLGLTRNGTLQVNARGQLTTNLGMPLEPPITLPKGIGPGQVQISPSGVVTVAGRRVATIRIVTVPAPDQLLASGNGVLSATAASGAIVTARGATLQQGSLEQSNVDLNRTMVDMMTAQQSYDLGAKAISFETQMGQIAATAKQ